MFRPVSLIIFFSRLARVWRALAIREADFRAPERWPEPLIEKRTPLGQDGFDPRSALRRRQNLDRAVESLNGLIIPPGRTFSLKYVLPSRISEISWEPAPERPGEAPVRGGGLDPLAALLLNLTQDSPLVSKPADFSPTASRPSGYLKLRFRNTGPKALQLVLNRQGDCLTGSLRMETPPE